MFKHFLKQLLIISLFFTINIYAECFQEGRLVNYTGSIDNKYPINMKTRVLCNEFTL